jgi:hypothetical protein
MELLRFEPCVVVVALAEADVKILAEGLEPETFLEPGRSDGRHEHAMAMQTAFVGLAEALRLQGRVIDTLHEHQVTP